MQHPSCAICPLNSSASLWGEYCTNTLFTEEETEGQRGVRWFVKGHYCSVGPQDIDPETRTQVQGICLRRALKKKAGKWENEPRKCLLSSKLSHGGLELNPGGKLWEPVDSRLGNIPREGCGSWYFSPALMSLDWGYSPKSLIPCLFWTAVEEGTKQALAATSTQVLTVRSWAAFPALRRVRG